MSAVVDSQRPWYSGISRYQWLVLVVASLGWAFDAFEGQIFVASMNEAMPELVPAAVQALPNLERQAQLAFYNNIAFAAFLVGGALGGVLFGMLADRIGRVRVLVLTIAMYSAFTCLSAFSQTWWHMAIFRFWVALGVGGEWAVASALVAEVFPIRARAWSLSIFHATSVLGSLMAVAAGTFIVAERAIADSIPFLAGSGISSWRIGFVLGALPALLIVAIRLTVREESPAWLKARDDAKSAGGKGLARFSELAEPQWRRRTLVGVLLASVGLATFWGTYIYGKDTLREAAEQQYMASAPGQTREEVVEANFPAIKRWEMLGMLLVTLGGGAGMLCFGPFSERVGRRRAFLTFHVAGLVAALVLFQGLYDTWFIAVWLPILGGSFLGAHAGYAVYFPELFPTRLRSTGAGFCFNMGRILAAPILFTAGWMQSDLGLSLRDSASLLSLLFVIGIGLYWFSPETKGTALPE